MRNVWLGLFVAGTAACTESATFEHRSELEFATRGVALGPDGRDGIVGMLGTTCQVQVDDARIGSDYNFPTDEESVKDNSLLDGVPAVVVISDQGAHVVFPAGWTSGDFGGPGVVDGRVWGSGVALLGDDGAGGCQVTWTDGTDAASLPVPGLCDASMAIDRADGRVFLGDASKVVSASPDDGVSDLGHDADLVVWDGAAEVLYAALTGDTMLYGLEADGAVRWATDVGGAIVSLDALGPQGKAVVMVSMDSGLGELLTVDGFTGHIDAVMNTPEAALHVESSDNGKTVALTLPREVHFFEVRIGD